MKIPSLAFPKGTHHEYPDICHFYAESNTIKKLPTYYDLFQKQKSLLFSKIHTAGVNNLVRLTTSQCGKYHENRHLPFQKEYIITS